MELPLPGVILLRRLLLHAMVVLPADGDRCGSLVLLRLGVVVSLLVWLMLDLMRMELLMMVERLLLLLLLRLLMHLHLLVMRMRVQALQ